LGNLYIDERIILKWIIWRKTIRVIVDFINSGQNPLLGFCEHGSELSCSLKELISCPAFNLISCSINLVRPVS
jgi:hypothetical protein